MLRADVDEHVVVLHRALQHLEEVHVADVRVDDRLEHERGRRAVAAAVGAGPSSTRNVASRSMPISLVALPHSTGNTDAARDTVGERVRELVDLDLLVAEVALHEVVVGDDDAFDERVVDRVLLGLHLGGDRALGALRVAVGVGDRGVVRAARRRP